MKRVEGAERRTLRDDSVLKRKSTFSDENESAVMRMLT